jgi:tetratricopeptide (TPR) repeat protein
VDPGALVGGRFIIERRAALGGMGAVFRARDLLDESTVALKILYSEDFIDVERFEREAKILSTLDHPGIVRYIAHGATLAGERYLAMEWLEGEDLSARLARRPLSPAESVTVLRATADALGHANTHGIVHRDIKPSNLFLPLGDPHRLKILDFGIARPNRDTAQLTYTGGVLGTPGYMAPEQLQGHAGRDPHLDVFSLGCVAFECLTGRAAFEGAHLMAALAKVLFHEPPRVRSIKPDVPEALEKLIIRMMSKQADERPADGAAVCVELARIAAVLDAWTERATDATLASPASVAASSVAGVSNALTLREQRLVSLVLAGDADAGPVKGDVLADWPDAAQIRAVVASCSANLVALRRDSLVAVVSGPGSAVDRAERAAQCALALSALLPALPVCVSTGRGIASAQLIEGNVIDRGVRALRATPAGTVRLDDVTASMLGARFKVRHEGDDRFLEGETGFNEEVPLLLGKPSPWVGRTRELRTLEGVFAGCVQESLASAVLVVGPAGSGKSRLRTEFLARAQQQAERLYVLIGRASSVAAGSPFGMISDAIRRTAGIRDDEPLEARRRKLVARLGRHLDGAKLGTVAGFLGELIGTPFPADHAPGLRAARNDAMLMNDATRTAWEDWLAAECAARPVLLVLEDLHWGDAATVRLIGATLRNLHDLPLMLLVLARPEVHDHFPELWAGRDVQEIKLGPLPAKASEQLVRGVLGDQIPADVVSRLVERADGNPFFLEEIIRAVAAGKADELPDSVLGTVEARLDAEGSEAKRVIRAASVFGDRFSRLGVAALLGGDARSSEIDATLKALSTRELISSTQAASAIANEYMFRHSIVREAGYAMLTEHDRVLGHRLAGEWLERTGHNDAMGLAEHFRRGDAPDRAVRWYRRAAEQALEANELTAALTRAARAAECGATGAELGAVRLIEAETHAWKGMPVEAEQRANEAMELLPPRSPAWFRAIMLAAHAAGKRGNTDRVAHWAVVARTPAEGDDAVRAQMMSLSRCGNYLVFGGRYAEADDLIAGLDRAAKERSALDPEVAAMLHQLRAFRASVAGDPGASLEHLQGALSAFEQAGDLRNACTTRTNVGCIQTELGDFEGAETTLRGALAIAGRLGLEDVEIFVLHNLGHVLLHTSSLGEARAVEQKAIEAFHRQGAARLEGVARSYAAKIALLAGDLAPAENEARAAADLLKAAPPLRAAAVAVLSRILLASGRAAEALETAREAYAQLEALGSLEEGEATVRLAYAEALSAAGQTTEAAGVLVAAREHLLARAAKISDATWRGRFLTQVPDNARTLELVPPPHAVPA